MITDRINIFYSLFNTKNIPLFLAPMAGFTDMPFRLICKELGADILWSEMVSSEGLIYDKNGKTSIYAQFNEKEKPIGIQLFGKDSKILSEAAKIIENEYNPTFIDLNAGCPVPKVTKKGKGSRLLENPQVLKDILNEMKKNIQLPLSVKIRSGWNVPNIENIINELNEANIFMIALHPRTGKQGFKGKADWKLLEKSAKLTDIPIIGSGDIIVPEDALRMIDTGIKGVMIGRGAIANPWIFRQIKTLIEKDNYEEASIMERILMLRKHIELSLSFKGERKTLIEMRKFYMGYLHSIYKAKEWRLKLINSTSFQELMDILYRMEKYYE